MPKKETEIKCGSCGEKAETQTPFKDRDTEKWINRAMCSNKKCIRFGLFAGDDPD